MKSGELHIFLAKVFRTHYRRSNEEFSKFGITQGQPRILNYLALHDGCIQRDLAVNCKIEPATVSNVLDNMEKLELVYRAACSDDRRVLNIFLTEKGRETQKQVQKVFAELEAECFKDFSEIEMEKALEFLKRMHKNMADAEEIKNHE